MRLNILLQYLKHLRTGKGGVMEEHRELTEEEIRMIREAAEFVGGISEELEGKQTSEILPFNISVITSVCLSKLYDVSPEIRESFSHELMSTLTLLAASILRTQEKKTKSNSALDKLWKEE